MPKITEVIQVLISSPGDVDTERSEVEQAIIELNEYAFMNLGIRLEPIRWENNCYPSVGTDSQAVVSEQLGDDYKIFIGIFWKKIGTPTPRALSGTLDEFERAYARWLRTGSPEIMFYFRNGSVLLSEVDPVQLAKINEFREKLKGLGVYFWNYTDQGEFAKLIRMQIPALLYGRINRRHEIGSTAVNSDITSTTKIGTNENNEDVEEGLLDLIAEGDETFEDLTEVVSRIATSIKVLGDKVETRSKEVNSKYKDRKILKQFGDRTAEDLENFANRLDVDIPQFAKLFSHGIDKYTRAFAISTDFKDISNKDLVDSLNKVIEMRTSIETARKQVTFLEKTIATSPRLTTAFVQSKRHAVMAIDTLLSEMVTAINLTSEMEKVIQHRAKEADATFAAAKVLGYKD